MDSYYLTTMSEMATVSNISTAETSGYMSTNTVSEKVLSVRDITSFAPYEAGMVLWKVCCPIILALGTFGNSMTLVILRTVPLGGAGVSVFFSALAASDLVVLYTGLLRRWVLSLWSLDFRQLHDVMCRMHLFLVYLSRMTSSWFLVAMTMQRVASVLWPHRVALLCTRRKSQITVLLMVATLTALNAHFLVSFTLFNNSDPSTPPCWYVDNAHLEHYSTFVYPWLDLVFTSFLPSLLLLLGNSALAASLYRSVRQARQMSSRADTTTTTTRKKAASSLTVTLMCVSVTFLCLTLPVSLFLITEKYLDFSDAYYVAWLELVWVVLSLLSYCNFAINFYVYCLTGTKFRVQCRRLLLCGAGRGARAMTTSATLVTSTSKTTCRDQHSSALGQNVEEVEHDMDDF
ncbi:uncharacterized protein LOC143296489 [Babylonia areolata]|uniref:uncharacterized protein LOC143296489 n=1 Tax=Babylonia areolata TaxID=304850 RepID=UPI003FD522E7